MVFDKVFQPFIEQSPVSVMFRGTLERVFSAERLDRIFETTAVRQRVSPVLFSTCADVLSLVVLTAHKSVHAAYQARFDELTFSVKAIYDKLAGIELAVSEQLVRETAADLTQVVDELRGAGKGPLPGYDTRIVDGNHLPGTDHRLKELRRLGAAPLPGQSLAVLDPQRWLIQDVVACEDGHANERTLIPAVLARVQLGQCWIADALFSTLDFFFGIRACKAYFLVRQHGGLKGELQGKQKKVGRGSTGLVYEQPLLVRRKDGTAMTMRRITIVRNKPTSRGEKEVHLLTNLPAKVRAVKAAEAYLDRWNIETAFQDLATALRSEINTLGYPKAALFGFCLALTMFNLLSVVRTALRRHAKKIQPTRAKSQDSRRKEPRLSMYYLADEVSGVWRGMEIAVPQARWEEAFVGLTPKQLAAKLKWLASRVDVRRFTTNPWTPKRPQPKRLSGHRGNHVSTHEILQRRKKPRNKQSAKTNLC
jgi:hypothetical protein